VRRGFESSGFADLPLELVVDEIVDKTGIAAHHLLEFLTLAVPNTNHAMLAALVAGHGVEVVTTNFDELIEAKLNGGRPDSRIVKIHGTMSDPMSLAIRLPEIGRGLVDRRLRRRLTDAVKDRDVVFVGYSGTDRDLTPILRNAPIRSCLWIVRPQGPHESLAELRAAHARLLRFFPDRVPVDVVSVDADRVFASLVRRTGVRVHSSMRSTSATTMVDWRRRLRAACSAASGWKAALCIARLFVVSGAYDEGADMLAELSGCAASSEERGLSALYRAEALYRRGQLARISGQEDRPKVQANW
jgi:hypothetical protein